MKIQDFADMKEFSRIISNWSVATGLAAFAVDADGKCITERYNFTDFCMKYTRGTREGAMRCDNSAKQTNGISHCHAGLIDFSQDLVVNGQKVGAVLGGQVLPEHINEEKVRGIAREIGVNEDDYIAALHKVNVRSEESIRASAELLGVVMNNFINAEYAKSKTKHIYTNLVDGVKETGELVEAIKKETGKLRAIQSRQKILALNASIEAARAGEKGAGFAVVASEVGKLSERSSVVNKNIEEVVNRIFEVVTSIQQGKK